MKLYTIKIEFDFVVVAEDETDAREVGIQHVSDAFRDTSPYQLDVDAIEGVHAYGWEDGIEPYGGEEGLTTGDYKKMMKGAK